MTDRCLLHRRWVCLYEAESSTKKFELAGCDGVSVARHSRKPVHLRLRIPGLGYAWSFGPVGCVFCSQLQKRAASP